jgi:excisionase family DNA binding protein
VSSLLNPTTPTPETRARRAINDRRAKLQRPQAPALDPVLSVKEVAALLGVHFATVHRLIAGKALTAVRLSARRIGIRHSVVEAFLARNAI